MPAHAKSLEQLKLDAARSDWGTWCKFWDRDPHDLHPGDERALLAGCTFDLAAAIRIHEFFETYLTVPAKGGGVKPFVLFDWWYREVFGPVFGWKRHDGRRRFTKCFVTTAKKSGKSTCLAGLPKYMMLADGEPEAECYATAVDRDQAAIIYRKSERMVKKSPLLSKRLKITSSQKRIYDEETGSFFEAISSDADSADGKNPHLLILDELHRWRDREFYNTLVYGDLQREQPLVMEITTAGDDLDGIGYEEYCYAKDLLDPDTDVFDLSRFAVICEPGLQTNQAGRVVLDEEGRPQRLAWDDPRAWIDANPIILEDHPEVRLERLKSNCEEARTSARKKRNFMRFICNLWVAGIEDSYIEWDDWLKCDRPLPASMLGRCCFGGLDLSSAIDLTALCLAFPDREGFDLLWKFWMPRDDLAEKEERDRVPYQDWVEQGWIEATPGRRVDYAYVRRSISGVELDEQGAALPVKWLGAAAIQYRVGGIGYDPYNAEKLVSELSEYDGLTMVEVRQGYATMNRPCKRFRDLVKDGKIRHGRNPVADWMIRNCKTDEDPAGNIKLNKKKSRKRIDGIVAAAMAAHLADSLPSASAAWSGAAGSGMWG